MKGGSGTKLLLDTAFGAALHAVQTKESVENGEESQRSVEMCCGFSFLQCRSAAHTAELERPHPRQF